MQCPVCTLTNNPDNNFCVACGNQLMRHCAACGHREAMEYVHCAKCGTPSTDMRLVGESASIALPLSTRATEIGYDKIELSGARKLVTVLFADAVSSTLLIGDQDPELSHEVIDQILDCMIEAVREAQGFVARVQGDGIMALFGAPLAQEHHALRACDAALAMQAKIRALGDDRISIRVGLNTGEVMARSIRNDLSVDYDVTGPIVNLASRMEQRAEPGGIFLTDNTLRLVKGFVLFEALGLVSVPGFEDDVAVFRLLARRQVRTRWEALRDQRTLSSFVGRDHELSILNDELAETKCARGGMISIIGDAGVGKSRLVHEFLKQHNDADIDFHVAGALRETQSTLFRPITVMLRDWAQIREHDNDTIAFNKFEACLKQACPTIEPDWQALRSLILRAADDDDWAGLEPQIKRRRRLDSIRDLVAALASERPQLIVIEDLHWVDRETLAALDHFGHALKRMPVLIVLTARMTQETTWKPKAETATIVLDCLGNQDADELMSRLLGDDPSLIHLKWRLAAEVEGVPMFLEQMVEALVEDSSLCGRRGNYRLEGSLSQLRLPATIHNVIAVRIDRLDPRHRQVLQVAAIVGRCFSKDMLVKISGKPDERVSDAVCVLCRLGFLGPSLDGDDHFCFAHSLIQEVVYGGMLKKRRRELHAKALHVLKDRRDLDPGIYIENLSRQALLGELWQEALDLSREAGSRARTYSAYHEAVHFFEMALQAASEMEGCVNIRRAQAEINIELSTVYPPLGEMNAGYAALKRAESLYETLGERDDHLEIGIYETAYHSVRGRLETAFDAGQEVLKRAQRLKRGSYVVAAKVYLAEAALFGGDYKRVAELIEPHLGALRGPLRLRQVGATATISIDGLGLLAMAYAHLGRFDEANTIGAEVTAIADNELRRPFDQGLAHFYYGCVRTQQGFFSEAMPSLERATAACEEGAIFMLEPWLYGLIGYSYLHSDRRKDARLLLERTITRADRLTLVVFKAMAMTALAAAALLDNRLDEAEKLAQDGLKLCTENGYRSVEMWLCRVVGQIASTRGKEKWAEAERYFLRSIAIGQELDMKPDLAICRLSFGQHLVDSGKTNDAIQHLVASERLITELKMDYWRPKLQAALSPLQGRDHHDHASYKIA